MKKIFLVAILLLSSFLFKSCIFFNNTPDEPQIQQNNYKPTIINRAAFENSVVTINNQNIVKSGKIYIKDNLLFVNDINKGFQVYNYTNPENPIKIGFIQILGATDLALRDNLIYINQAVDLVTLEYNPANNSIIKKFRNKNVFPPKRAPNGASANTNQDQIVIDWIQI